MILSLAYHKNETSGIELAKQRMKEKMQKKHFPYSKRYFENAFKRINRLLENQHHLEDITVQNTKPNPNADLDTTSQEFLDLFQNISYQIYNNSGNFDYEITLEIDEDEDDDHDDYDIPEIFVVSNKQAYPKTAKEPHTRNRGKIPRDRSNPDQKKKKSEKIQIII